MQLELQSELDQFSRFPGSRYMGSKNKIINELWSILRNYNFDTFFDAFAGSNVVSYFIKCQGKEVITNDFMKISYLASKAIIENSSIKIDGNEIDFILTNKNKSNFQRIIFWIKLVLISLSFKMNIKKRLPYQRL